MSPKIFETSPGSWHGGIGLWHIFERTQVELESPLPQKTKISFLHIEIEMTRRILERSWSHNETSPSELRGLGLREQIILES